MGEFEAYPIRFEPLYKEKIWGGRRLEEVLGKALPDDIFISFREAGKDVWKLACDFYPGTEWTSGSTSDEPGDGTDCGCPRTGS